MQKKKKKIIALYLILKIWSQTFGVSSFHFCSVYYRLFRYNEIQIRLTTFSTVSVITLRVTSTLTLYSKRCANYVATHITRFVSSDNTLVNICRMDKPRTKRGCFLSPKRDKNYSNQAI